MAQQSTTQVTTDMQRCIEECKRCHAICLTTVGHCLELGGKHADPAHIRLLLDCAEICQTSANFMLRGSGLHPRTCAVCAEICRTCAKTCDRMPGSDQMLRDCAEQCRRCEESCRQMAA